MSESRMWRTATSHGELIVQIPVRVDSFDVEEIEHIFALILRGIKRRHGGRPMIEADLDDAQGTDGET